jgi:hypothetical protein
MTVYKLGEMDKWTRKAQVMTDEVLQVSIGLLVEELVKAMPVDTGNLVNSVEISLDGIKPVDKDPKATYTDPSAENAAVLKQAKPGEKVYISVKAPYAVKANYGQTQGNANRPGHFFMIIAANKWPVVVRRATEIVKARYA